MDTELQELYDEIVQCLIYFGGLTENEAQQKIDSSLLFSNTDDEIGQMNLFHEESYYWAQSLLHARDNPYWYQDPKLWPPPKDYWQMWEEQ